VTEAGTEERTLRVLIVEDNAQYAYLIREYLHLSHGAQFEADRAECLGEALQRLEQDVFDLILLDLDLPDSKGLDTLDALREHCASCPVVVLTGHDDMQLAADSLGRGAQDFLMKGRIDQSGLAQAMLHAVHRQRATRKARLIEGPADAVEQRFRTLIESTLEGIVILDDACRVQFANHAALDLLGRATEDLLDEPLDVLVADGTAAEFDLVRPDQSVIVADIRATETRWENERALMVSIRDVTDRRRAAELQSRLEEEELYASQMEQVAGQRNDLLLGLTQRLRAPIQPLQSAIELFRSEDIGPLTPQQRQILRLMARNVRRLSRFYHEARQLSKIETGDQPLSLRDVDLAWSLRPALEFLAQHAAQQEMTITVGPHDDLCVHADPDAVSDVLICLVENAIAHNPNGTQIGVRFSRQQDGFLTIAVEDDGEGILEESLAGLFSTVPFDDSLEITPQAAGLGLSLSRSLVDKMGGTISANSVPGEGSTFRFTLPIRPLTPSTVFGRVARDLGYLDDRQVEALHRFLSSPGSRKQRIGEFLVEREYLTEDQRDEVLKELNKRLSTPHPRGRGSTYRRGLLGRIALGNGSLSDRQLNEALRIQESRRVDGDHVLLGRVLVEAGFMNEGQLLDALAEQGVHVMACTRCGSSFNLLSLKDDAHSICAACGSPVQPAEAEASLEISGEILPVDY